MSKNAIYLLQDPEKLAQFRINALERAKYFSLERILPMYEALYLNSLKTRI
ncbi:MAG: hypothetical protein ACI9XP_001711 [Lentimonas sp.]|jgi:hypothetical protein